MAASAAEGLGVEIELQLRVASLEAENKALREILAQRHVLEEKEKMKAAEEMAKTLEAKVAALESQAEMTNELVWSLDTESTNIKLKRHHFLRQINTENAKSMFDELNRTMPYKDKLQIRRVGEVQQSTTEEMLGIMRSRNRGMDMDDILMAVIEEVTELNKLMIKAEFRPLKVTTTMERGQEVRRP